MRKLTTIMVLMALVLGAPGVARADWWNGPWDGPGESGKAFIGGMFILTGIGLMIGAFDFHSGCNGGTTVSYHANGYSNTDCVYSSPGYVSVTDPDTDATFKRPKLMWTGIGMVVGGIVLTKLPDPVKKLTPDVSVDPQAVSVSKTIEWK